MILEKLYLHFSFRYCKKKSGQYLQLTKRMIDSSFEYFKDKDFEFSIKFFSRYCKRRDF